jgi:hypothetical protein
MLINVELKRYDARDMVDDVDLFSSFDLEVDVYGIK